MEGIKFNIRLFIYSALVLIFGIIIGIFLNNKNISIPKTPEKQEAKQEIKKEIKIAQMPLGFGTFFPLYVAQEEGFFDKNNLTVKFEQMERGISIQTLLAKKIDYAPFVEEGTAASLNGAPVKTIMFFSENASTCLVIRPGIKPEAIKIVAVTQGSWGHYSILKLFKEKNIFSEFIYVNSLPEAKSLLETKRVDAVTMPVPTAFQFREQGFEVLDLSDREALFGLVTTDEKIKNNPEEIKGVVRGIQSAIAFIQNNPEKTKELLFEFSGYKKNDINKKIIEDTYLVGKKIFRDIKTPNTTIIKEMIQIEKNIKFENLNEVNNQAVSSEDILNAFDFRFVK